jgi:hypothetical protein
MRGVWLKSQLIDDTAAIVAGHEKFSLQRSYWFSKFNKNNWI